MIDYLEQGRAINGAYHAGKLRWLCLELASKMQGKLIRCFILLQDNVPAHASQIAMIAATECGFRNPSSSLIFS